MELNILVWSVLIICSGLSCFCIGMLNSYRKDIAKDRKELEESKSNYNSRSYDRDRLERIIENSSRENRVMVEFNRSVRDELEESRKARSRTELLLERAEKRLKSTEQILERTERELYAVKSALEDAETRIERLEYDNALIKRKLEIRDKIGVHCKVVEPFKTVL